MTKSRRGGFTNNLWFTSKILINPPPPNQLTLIAEQVFEYLRWVGAGFLVLGIDDINLGEPAPTNI